MRLRVEKVMRLRANAMRLAPTPLEYRLWYHLKILNRRGFHFRRQAPFGRYILDFVDHRHRLVIEVDGSQHGAPANRARDEARDSVLTREGYRVLRFSNREVRKNIDGVVETIVRSASAADHPPPDPSSLRYDGSTSPQGGGNRERSYLPRVGRSEQ